jgi:putative copper resistance protein D
MTVEPIILVRFASFAVLLLLFGLALFGRGLSLRLPSAVLAIGGILLAGLELSVMAAGMSGVPLAQVERASIDLLLNATTVGSAIKVRMAVLALTLACVAMPVGTGTFQRCIVSVLSGTAIATLAWSGHAAATEGTLGLLHRGADILHLLAAGAWIGAIVALGWRMIRIGRPEAHFDELHRAHRALSDFSVAGTVIVGLIVVTGIINSLMLIPPAQLLSLPDSLYGRLLIVKLALFLLMLALASANRFRLTPDLEAAIGTDSQTEAVAVLRRSLAIEAGAALAILALVAWLGTLAPPMSGS